MEHSDSGIPQEPCTTSYRLEPGVVRSLWLILLLALAGAGFELFTLLTRPLSPFNTIFGVAVIAFLAWVIRIYVFMVTYVSCTDTGLDLTTLLGMKESIEWSELRLFRNKGSYVLLVADDHPRFYLYLFPNDAMFSLASVLRESTNARVMGFGEKI